MGRLADSTAWHYKGSTRGHQARVRVVFWMGPSDCIPRELRMVRRGTIKALEGPPMTCFCTNLEDESC